MAGLLNTELSGGHDAEGSTPFMVSSAPVPLLAAAAGGGLGSPLVTAATCPDTAKRSCSSYFTLVWSKSLAVS